MRGAPSGSPAAAMGQSLFQDAGRRREAQCSVCGKLRSHTSASFKKCSGCRGPELYCSDGDCFARGWIRHKPICFERRGAVAAPEDIAARDAVLEEERMAWLREAEALASKVDTTPDSNQRALLLQCCRSSITMQYNVVSQELAAFRPSFAHTSDDTHAIMLAHLPPSGLDSVLEPALTVRRPRPSSHPLQFASTILESSTLSQVPCSARPLSCSAWDSTRPNALWRCSILLACSRRCPTAT